MLSYTITALGGFESFPNGINNAGQIVGQYLPSFAPLTTPQAFLYQNGTFGALGISGENSDANAINDAGAIVGELSGHAVVWQNGNATNLGNLQGAAYGINNSQQIVGGASNITSTNPNGNAFLYQQGTAIDLGTLGGPTSQATAINDAGQIVGFADKSSAAHHAFLYQNGNMSDLGTLGGSESEAEAINAGGQIVGFADTSANVEHAFVYENGSMTDLGTLAGMSSFANGINDLSQIVGGFQNSEDVGGAFLYQSGTMTDLNTLVAGSGWTLQNAYAINDKGQIVCVGRSSSSLEALLLTPVGVSDIVLTSVSTTDANELTVNYTVDTADMQNKGAQSFNIGIYRSNQPTYNLSDPNAINVEVASCQVGSADFSDPSVTMDSSDVNWGMNANTLVAPLAPDPQLPYVLAVVDPNHQLPTDVTSDDSAAEFRIYTIAAVTQGFGAGKAAWVQCMVDAVKDQGYDAVAPIYWNSAERSAGQTTLGAESMVIALVAEANSLAAVLKPNDIIDVQLIGHSRGSAVIDQAMQMLINVTPGSVLEQLAHGYYELTFLDPHPANSQTVGLASMVGLTLFSPLTSLLGYGVYNYLSNVFQDPNLVVPARVNQAEDYYQQNPTYDLSVSALKHMPLEALFNLWGLAPNGIQIVDSAKTLFDWRNLSSLGLGHSEIWQWYQNNVVPLLGQGGIPPFAALGGATGGSSPGPATQLIVVPSADLTVDGGGDLDPASAAPFTLYALALNAQGNLDTGFNGTVNLALASNPGQAVLGGTLIADAVDGVATFAGLTLSNPGIGYTFSVSSPGLSGGMAPPLDIEPDQLAVTVLPPTTVTAGTPFGLTVTAEDGAGNTDTSFTGNVTLLLNDVNDTKGTLGGTVTVAAINGVATFTDLSVDEASDDWTVSASATGAAGTVSNSFDVIAGTATQLQMTIQPGSDVTAGSDFAATVAAEDSFGNVDATFDSDLTLSLTGNRSGSSLHGALIVPAVNGVATFNGLTIDEPGSDYVIQAASSTLSTTSAVTVTAQGVATRLAVTVQPQSAVEPGTDFGLVVAAEDAFGTVDTSFNGNVTVVLDNLLGQSETLGGTVTEAAVNGVVSFTNLAVSQVGQEYTLQASAAGEEAATTNPFAVVYFPSFSGLSAPTITYGSATTTVSGQLDANSNGQHVPVGETVQVTLNGVTQNATLAQDDSFSTSFATAELGVASSPYTITFSYAGDTDFNSTIASATLKVAAASLTVTATGTKPYGAPTPTLMPIYSGFVNNETPAVLIGDPSLSTTVSASTPVGIYPISVSSGTLSAANYAFIFKNGVVTVTAPTAALFTITGATGATAGTLVNEIVTVLDAYGDVVTGYTGTVHFTSTDSAANLPANYTFDASDDGIHTFSVTMKSPGPQYLTATDTSNATVTGSGLIYTANSSPPSALLPTVANDLSHSYQYYYQFVVAAYRQYLGRAPSLGEANGWVTDMENGLSDEWVEALFIGSTEYIANHGGAGAGWVTGMYENLLGRVPSQAEVNQWVADINEGLSTTTIAYSFAAGTEREDNRVTADYEIYLDRAPSQSEVNAWVNDFELGLSNEDVIAGFVGGSEFYTKSDNGPSAWLDAAYVELFGGHADLTGYDSWMPLLT